MPDTQSPSTRVIPLFPGRSEKGRRPAASTLMEALRTCLSARLPAEASGVLREGAGKAASFLAPGILLAAGAGLLGLLLGHVLAAVGAGSADPALIGGTAGRWTLLATTGCALAARGYRMARDRWT